MVRKRIPYGTKIPVFFTDKEVADIREHTLAESDFKFGVLEGSKLRINLSLDDIEDLQGHVAATSNHTESKQLRRRLDKIFLKLDALMQEYDDQEESGMPD